MNNLIINENIKLYYQRSTQVLFVLLFLFVLCGGIISKVGSGYLEDNPDWKDDLTKYNSFLTSQMEANPQYVEPYTKEILMNEYRIKNNYEPIADDNIWGFINSISGKLSIATIFSIIIASSILTNEYKWGTLKNLLVKPYSKSKILASKFITVLIYACVQYLLMLFFSWLIGGFMFGFSGTSQPHLFVENNVVKEINLSMYVLINYGLDAINLVVLATVAFMISTLFNNSAISIGVSITIMFSLTVLTDFFSDFFWNKYSLFSNLHLEDYLFGGVPKMEGMTLYSSLFMISMYQIMFLLITWITFTKIKRDV